MGRFLVLALTVTFMVAYASALSCYQCQYTDGEAESVANQKNCADTFNSQNIATATTVSGMDCASCVAIKSTYKGKVTTMRTCRPDGVLSGPGVPVGCTTDNCNNGTASEYPVSQLPAPATDLSCYQCAYDGDIAEHAFNQRNCADPFKPEGINKIIAIGGMGCVTCINGKAIVNGKTVTQRTCMPFDIPAGIGGLETCMTNNCNGGTAPLVTIPPLPGTGPTVETVNGSTGLTVPTISESTGSTGATVNGGTGLTVQTFNGSTGPTGATVNGGSGTRVTAISESTSSTGATVNGDTARTVQTVNESTGPTVTAVNGSTGATVPAVNGSTSPTRATTVGTGGSAKAAGVTALVLGALFVCL